ncbi:multiheme c-type cytochrome [Deferribacter desulfuricans SSM1]|uniref:Multiheme c-type cytochrome n=1 Tax=Deferribacter desulfuricans (strain DSM 14783 / JCM 11476 / NBRC 101012 / SSM1) TaxID=639282 RepID=D3PCA9_DEFDS|nr:cytochrome c3 family protein [Deferribacter desulfuricans]BAI80232.1 multiheme c-type cytochrome [Deferribacter desulfuricans SSM1]
MKKLILLATLILLPTFVFAGVAGSAHDFSQNSASSLYGGTACGGCHKPHNAGTLIPLWNDSNTFDGQYTAYSSPTDSLNATPNSTLGSVSKACMACHDGMINDTVNGGTAITALKATVTVGLDIDYQNDAQGQHPVSIQYVDNGTATSLKPLANVKAAGFKFYGTSGDILECGTCHDPHAGGSPDFLRADKAQLCQTCHNN